MAIELQPPVNPGDVQSGGRNWSGGHPAKDIAVPWGSEVRAAYDGNVVRASYHVPAKAGARSYGNVIVIEHKVPCGDGQYKYFYTLYAHLSPQILASVVLVTRCLPAS